MNKIDKIILGSVLVIAVIALLFLYNRIGYSSGVRDQRSYQAELDDWKSCLKENKSYMCACLEPKNAPY